MQYNKKWYNKLNKSPLNPPDWVFGLVWPILYILLTISLYLAWTNKKCSPYCRPITFFLIQLVLNLSWTNIFFKQQKTQLALFVLAIIIFFTFKTYNGFKNINKLSSYLIIPYLAWICFAFYLNLHIVLNN